MQILRRIGFFTAFIIPALTFGGFKIGGMGNYSAILFSFIILPLLDQRIGTTNHNEAEDESGSSYYSFVLFSWTFFQLAFMFWGVYAITSGHLVTFPEWIGFTISFALVTGGIGITVAHELGHKKSFAERLSGKLLLMTVGYMHFYIEHNRGHHVQVATPADPATGRKGENFYSFWIRSVFGSYAHAWKLEAESLKRRGKGVLGFSNAMIWFAIAPIIFLGVLMLVGFWITGLWEWKIALWFGSQSIIAFTLLELVNYVEHYGITRKEISPGRFERVNPMHSWNASFLLSNFFLFQLQRHSDHHYNAIRRYQVLRHHDEAPQLPFGYPTMILIALVPPLWFSIMDRRLETWSVEVATVSADFKSSFETV